MEMCSKITVIQGSIFCTVRVLFVTPKYCGVSGRERLYLYIAQDLGWVSKDGWDFERQTL